MSARRPRPAAGLLARALFLQAVTVGLGAAAFALAGAAARVGPDRFWLGLLGGVLLAAPLGWVFARHLETKIRLAAAAEREPDRQLAPAAEDRALIVGAMAHDLRGPLSRIRFRLERDPVAAKSAVLADLAQMEAMIAGVLDLTRAGQAPAPTELIELRSVLEYVADGAPSSAVRLQDGAPLLVRGDALGLSRLFSNLVDNALKYGGTAQLRACASGDSVLVEVQDHGPGIAPEDLERVFTPFFRGGAALSLDVRGVGLGLSVARSLARAHGGEVTLDQQPGAGLKVRVRLPLARAAADAGQLAAAS